MPQNLMRGAAGHPHPRVLGLLRGEVRVGREPSLTSTVFFLPSRRNCTFTLSPVFLAPTIVVRRLGARDGLAVDLLDDVAAELDGLAADVGGDVAAADARLGRRAAGLDGLHERAALDREVERALSERVDRAARDAEVGAVDPAAVLELGDDLLGGVDRDGEADADVAVPAAARLDLRVDPDDAAGRVEQRAARVAGVDRGVGLDDVADREAVGRLDLALQRGDDAGRQRAVEAERVADGDRRVADLDGLRRAELER